MTAGKKVLIVGAGGIGCELLKDLALLDSLLIQSIDIVDMDTIDISNLNRQFLFQKCHVTQSKAMVAKESIEQHYRPCAAPITAYHANIKESLFDVRYFRQFGVVLNALDNIDARRHVNYMCCLANVPLVESGTAGYLGQVTVIQKGITECFDCFPKEPPTTFPICTIRSTPTELIHTIVWAKEFLLLHLFGPDSWSPEDMSFSRSPTDQDSANQDENNALHQELLEFSALAASKRDADFPTRMIFKVFVQDIARLAAIDELWRSRARPTPLALSREALADLLAAEKVDYASVGHDFAVLSLRDSVKLLIQSTLALVARDVPVFFDKDDAEVLDFVCSAANVRATVFGISNESRFKIKAMAGNIVPAIATTNAVIAGLATVEAMKILSGRPFFECTKTYYVPTRQDMIFALEKLSPPNSACLVCQRSIAIARCNTKQACISDLLKVFGTSQVTLSEGSRILYDPELETHQAKPLDSLGLGGGKILQLEPEVETFSPWVYIVEHYEQEREEKGDLVRLEILYKARGCAKQFMEEAADETDIHLSLDEPALKKSKIMAHQRP